MNNLTGTTPSSPDDRLLFLDLLGSFLVFPLLVNFLTCAWIVYLIFYNSRVVAIILKKVVNHFLGSQHIHIGSFSFSVLSGKIMLRDVAYITEDYTFRAQDALIILRWWKPFKPLGPKDDASQRKTRLNVYLYGMEFHCYNRSELYSKMEKAFGLPPEMIPEQRQDKQVPENSSVGDISNREAANTQESTSSSSWRDFFGVVKFEINGGRFVFGNNLVPSVLVVGVEEMSGSYTTKAPSSQWDLYMHEFVCTVEGLRVMMATSPNHQGKLEPAPRYMGEGFVVYQSNKTEIMYCYDEPGIQPSEEERGDLEVPPPCHTVSVTCEKGTQITYGPWVDRQRSYLQRFFYPQEYKNMPVTPPTQPGERRTYPSLDMRLKIVSKASLELLFMKGEDTQSLHIEIDRGSYVEASIPFLMDQDGYHNTVKGQLFRLDASTNMDFRPFIKCETMEFDVNMHYPRMWNHDQTWNITITMSKASCFFLFDHRFFITDMITDWSSKEQSDSFSFVPYSVHLNIVFPDFELILPNNEYNWIDCSSFQSQQQENVYVGLVGKHLDISMALPFSEFQPDSVPINVLIRADSVVASMKLPDTYVSQACLTALDKSAKANSSWNQDRTAMNIPEEQWRDFTSKPGWVEGACAPVVAVSLLYSYHPVPLDEEVSLLVGKRTQEGLWKFVGIPPKKSFGGVRKGDFISNPMADLAPDILHLEIDIGPLSIVAYGAIAKLFLAIKGNYLGEFEYSTNFMGGSTTKQEPHVEEGEKQLNPFRLRHLDVTVSLNIDGIKGHLPMHCSQADASCPSILMEQLCLEVQKTYTQTRIQLLLSPILLSVADTNQRDGLGQHLKQGHLGLSGVQLRFHTMFSGEGLPPDSVVVEYAWLVDIQLGVLSGRLTPSQSLCLMEAIQTFLHLAVDPMDKLAPIMPVVYCIHMNPQKDCTIKESHCPVPCPIEGALKYRMTRLSVSGAQLQIVETGCALDLKVDDIRLSTCNAHSRTVEEGLTVTVQNISVHQYVCSADMSTQQDQIWLDAGFLSLGPLNLDLVDFVSKTGNTKAIRHFLQKHDAKSKRLWFLWRIVELPLYVVHENHHLCGCQGGCQFFSNKYTSRESFRRGETLSLSGASWKRDALSEGSDFGESLLQQGQIAFAACDKTPSDSPSKSFKFTRGWVNSSASPSSDGVAESISRKEEESVTITDAETSTPAAEVKGHDGAVKEEVSRELKIEDEVSTPEMKINSVPIVEAKRASSYTLQSEKIVDSSRLAGSSHSLPVTAHTSEAEKPPDGKTNFETWPTDKSSSRKQSVDNYKSNEEGKKSRRNRSTRKEPRVHRSSSSSISDEEYYSANEDIDSDLKSRERSGSDASFSKHTMSRSTTGQTSMDTTKTTYLGPGSTVSSLKVESPSRKVSTSSSISFKSVSKQEEAEAKVQMGLDEHFSGYIPYLHHTKCQEWLKSSPSSVESWRTTDPYMPPYCGNFLRTGIMRPPQFHIVQEGIGPKMISDRPRGQDFEDEIQELPSSSEDELEDFSPGEAPRKAHPSTGTALHVDIDQPINISLTPMFLEALTKFSDSLMSSATSQHASSLMESIHHDCVCHATSRVKKSEKKTVTNDARNAPSEMKVSVRIPRINVCMLQVQPWTSSANVSANNASLLLLHFNSLSFHLMTVVSKPILESPTSSQDASPSHGAAADMETQPLLDSIVSKVHFQRVHCQIRRLGERRSDMEDIEIPTAIQVQHSRVSFCLDPLDYESLKRTHDRASMMSENVSHYSVTSTIMAECGWEDIDLKLGNGVEKLSSKDGGKKLMRSMSVPGESSPIKNGGDKHTKPGPEDRTIGKGATSVVLSLSSFWNHMPTPPHPRKEQAAHLLDFNLLTTASPALDCWLHSASDLHLLAVKMNRMRRLRSIALITYLMAEAHDDHQMYHPLKVKHSKLAKSASAISEDLSCQLVLVLSHYIECMDPNQAEEIISAEDLPAIITLEHGARVLLRQWKVTLSMLNPILTTMNFLTSQPGRASTEFPTNENEIPDLEIGRKNTIDRGIFEEVPSDGSLVASPKSAESEATDRPSSRYKYSDQIYSGLSLNMYDELSERKQNQSYVGSSLDGHRNVSYSRMQKMKSQVSSSTLSADGSYVGSTRTGKGGYHHVTDLEKLTELSISLTSLEEENQLEEERHVPGDIEEERESLSTKHLPEGAPFVSSSATQIGDIEVLFKPVLRYLSLHTKDKVSALKQIVEIVGQLSFFFSLDEFEICITKSRSKAMKEKHTKKLSRGKPFQRMDFPAFSCQDISFRLFIQESLHEVSSSVQTANDVMSVGSSPVVKTDAPLSGNIEVVLDIHFGRILQVVNMAILRLIIQVVQVIKNFQHAKTDLKLKEYELEVCQAEGNEDFGLSDLGKMSSDGRLGGDPLSRQATAKKKEFALLHQAIFDVDDLGSTSSRSGSETIPKCWQTMYHLLNLYSTNSDEGDSGLGHNNHLYINPLCTVETETEGSPTYRSRYVSGETSQAVFEPEHAIPGPETEPSSSIGLSVSCSASVDETVILAELAGLHLEVEVFDIAMGLSASHSLLSGTKSLVMKHFPNISASLQSPSISTVLAKTSKSDLMTIASLNFEKPGLSGALKDSKPRECHATGIFNIKAIVLDIPLDISMLTDVVAECSKKLAVRIKQLRQAERSYRPLSEDSIPHILEPEAVPVPSNGENLDLFYSRDITWVVTTATKIDSISIQASLLPQLFTQYMIEKVGGSFLWKNKGLFAVTIPKHTLKFSVKTSDTETPAEVIFPKISFEGQIESSTSGTPEEPSSKVAPRSLIKLNAKLEVDSFHHHLSSTLLNYVIIVERILAQELSVLIKELQNRAWPSLEDLPSRYTEPPRQSNLIYTLLVCFKGLQLTASSPSASAVRLETGNVEMELTNKKELVNQFDETDGKIEEIASDFMLQAKALIELSVSLGTLTKNPVFAEAEPEFDELAYFKTKIGLTNSPKAQEQQATVEEQPSVPTKQAFLLSLVKPVLFVQPHAVDKALMVWLSYVSAYEQFIEQWQNTENQGILLAPASVSSSQPHLPLSHRKPVFSQTAIVVQLTVKEMGICVPFLQSTPNVSVSGGRSELETQAALIISLESSLISVHLKKSLVTKGVFNSFCMRFTEHFQMAMDTWVPDSYEDLYNACVVPKGTFEVGSKADTLMNPSQGIWKIGFRWYMEGMDMKVDPSIGHHMSALINTLTSIAGSEDVGDLTSVAETQEGSSNDALSDQESAKPVRPTTLKVDEDVKKQGKRKIEIMKEIQEQAKILSDLKSLGAKSGTIKEEAERLEKLEAEALRDIQKNMRKRFKEMGKTMAGREDSTRRKKSLQLDKESPQNELHAASKRLAERRATLLSLRLSQTVRPRAVSTIEPTNPFLTEGIQHTPTTPREFTTTKWWTERHFPRPGATMETSRGPMDLNMTIADPTRFRDDLTRRRRMMLQSSQSFAESDSGSCSDSDSGHDLYKDEVDGGSISLSKDDLSRSRLLPEGSHDVRKSAEDVNTEAQAGQLEPNIKLDLDVLISIDCGKLSFHCHRSTDDNSFRKPGIDDPNQPWMGKSSTWPNAPMMPPPSFPTLLSEKSPQGVSFFTIPAVEVKAHYNSDQTDASQMDENLPASSSPLPGRADQVQTKRGLLYVWSQMKTPKEEIIVTTTILDFLEQALMIIPSPAAEEDMPPSASSPSAGGPSQTNNDKSEIDASTNSLVSSATDYTTFPVDIIVYFCVQPSVIHFSCLPASRVECLLQLPCVELAFTSTEAFEEGDVDGANAERFYSPARGRHVSGDEGVLIRKPSKTGFHCSAVFSDFSLMVYHPYGEQLKVEPSAGLTDPKIDRGAASEQGNQESQGLTTRRNALSLEVSVIKLNLSKRQSRHEDPEKLNFSLQSDSSHNHLLGPKIIINKFSIMCDMGSASFQYDMRRLTEVLAFPKAWYRKSLVKRMFLGKEAKSPESDGIILTGTPVSSEDSDDELSSSSSSSDTEDSFSRLPSRRIKKRRSTTSSSSKLPFTPPSPSIFSTYSQQSFDAQSSGDDDVQGGAKKGKAQRRVPQGNRRAIMRSFHKQYTKEHVEEDTDKETERSRVQSPSSSSTATMEKKTSWKTVVVIAINVANLDTQINMSNVMGTTEISMKELRGQSNITMDSSDHMDVQILTNLASFSLESKGGVVGGLLETKGLHVAVVQKRQKLREPHHNIKIGMGSFEGRLDYMGSSCLLADLTGLHVSEKDEWKFVDNPGQSKDINLQSMYSHTSVVWDAVHLIICRSTTPDILRAANRLEEFVTQQLASSKRMLSVWRPSLGEAGQSLSRGVDARKSSTTTQKPALSKKRSIRRQKSEKRDMEEPLEEDSLSRWQSIFRWCSETFRSPTQDLRVGGQITLKGKKAVVTCFHGLNFRSPSWALFTMREPYIQFDTDAIDLTGDQESSDETLVIQNLVFNFGHNQTQREDGWLAMIHRVNRNERSHFPFGGKISECFRYVSSITCPDESEQYMHSQEFFPQCSSPFPYKHKADPIFALPKLQIEMKSTQPLKANGSQDRAVQTTFVTNFTDHMYVSMDVELLLYLHDLVRAYMGHKEKVMSQQSSSPASNIATRSKASDAKELVKVKGQEETKGESSKSSATSSPSKDKRVFTCTTWQLEPTVRLLSWGGKQIEPVGADYVLNKLGFKHARVTIPKWIQRGVLDPCDVAVSMIIKKLLEVVKEEEKKSEKKNGKIFLFRSDGK